LVFLSISYCGRLIEREWNRARRRATILWLFLNRFDWVALTASREAADVLARMPTTNQVHYQFGRQLRLVPGPVATLNQRAAGDVVVDASNDRVRVVP